MAKSFWQRSILIEIVNKDNPANAIEAFTLSKPPDSMEIKVPQRVSRSKTFGGVFEDDYGLDNDTITISGDTGGVDVWEIYRRSLPMRNFTGKEAIFYLRDRIIKYKQNYPNYENYELRVYDLSAAPDEMPRSEVSNVLFDGYVCSLDDFQIKRSKDKPLFYTYTINLFVLRPLGVKILRTRRAIPKIERGALLGVVQSIRGLLNDLNEAFAGIESITNQIDSAIELAGDLLDQTEAYVDRAGELIRYPASAAKKVLNVCKDIRDSVSAVPDNFTEFWEAFGDDWVDVWETAKDLVGASSYMVSNGKTAESSSTANLQFSTSGSSVSQSIGVEDSQDTTLTVYGRSYISADSETTLEQLATEYYGNPDYAKVIADYNNITSDDEIEIGDTIAVPILSQVTVNDENQVYDIEGRDLYGTDIAIGGSGEMVLLETGDYSTITNTDNLLQSLNLVLSETLGARVRLTSYGILVMVGSPGTAPISYIVANIKDAVIQDPRIKEVTNISVIGNGDSLTVAFDFVTNVGENIEYIGAI